MLLRPKSYHVNLYVFGVAHVRKHLTGKPNGCLMLPSLRNNLLKIFFFFFLLNVVLYFCSHL